MKKLFLATVALVALAAPASAADLAARPYAKAAPMVAPIYNWGGFYVGINGGGGSARKCWDLNNFLGFAMPSVADGCHDATGAIAGGQIGYRWQAASWVFGLEAQGDWADLKGSSRSIIGLGATTNQTKVEALGLFTGQVGYAWNNALWYVKGGAAVTSDKYNGIETATGLVQDRASETRWGAVVGTGVEFGVAPNWSVAVEYDHLFMGRRDVSFISVAPVAGMASRTENIKQDVDMATVRVNYRWGGPVVAKY
jgi:outer membrane immunogenic protein